MFMMIVRSSWQWLVRFRKGGDIYLALIFFDLNV